MVKLKYKTNKFLIAHLSQKKLKVYIKFKKKMLKIDLKE